MTDRPVKQIKAFTTQATPANGDFLLMQEVGGSLYKKTTLQNVIATIGIVVDLTPVLGGNLDTAGFNIFSSSGGVVIDDNLAITGGTITLDNTLSFQIEDSVGTARRIMRIRASNEFNLGPIDTGWGAATVIGAGTVLTFQVNGASGSFTRAMDISADGNVLIGTTTDPSANDGKILVFGDNAGQPTMGSNTAGLYGFDVAGTVEMFAVDEAGNDAQLTSHDFTLFTPDILDVMPWSYSSSNKYIGKRIGVDMNKAIRLLEGLTGEKLIYLEDLAVKRDWAQDQAANVARREEEIAKWETDKSDDKGDRPEPIVAKSEPEWIALRK